MMSYSKPSLVKRRSHEKHQRRLEKKREKVYKLSVRKLKSIPDRDVVLCKSVLITNILHGLRKRKASETRSVEDILSQVVPLPPLIEDIEDLCDMKMLGDALAPGEGRHSDDPEDGIASNNSDEIKSKPKNYRIQSNPKRDGRRNQTDVRCQMSSC